MNPLVARVMSTVAGQLGYPRGVLGRATAVLLNRANRVLIEEAVRAADPGAGETAADIGFGGGVGLTLLGDRVGAQGLVFGIEVSGDMAARGRARFAKEIAAGTLRIAAGSLTALPVRAGMLDAVITVNTVYFVPELDRVAAEFARVLSPEGRAVIGIGDPDDMARMPFTRYGFRLRSVAEIVAVLEAAGLRVEHRTVQRKPINGHLLIARRA
ncbi:methyltransferase domain-containing protein [Nocardia sp. NPDC057668]|uniref:methyltransferase domain-containing protein n=1 Tax=Nocardia sp. NPDC057668 TaxID=3346202 RepID=UPI003671B82E